MRTLPSISSRLSLSPFVASAAAALLLVAGISACTGETTTGEPEGTPEGGEPDVAEPDPFADYGEPIDAPELAWTWIDFPDTKCGDGSETGAAINPGTSGRVVFYLEGGGACWDGQTCNFGQLATNVQSGFDGNDAAGYFAQFGERGIWDRNNDDNPFKDDSFVWVPYCTGDLHAGTVETNGYNVMHVGYNNVEAILQRVVPTFGDADSVVLTGTSAGGFGAILNFEHVQSLFQHIPVHLLVDSAPPMTNEYIKQDFQDIQRAAWGLDNIIPDDCADCSDFHNTFIHFATKYEDRNIGLVSSYEDQTLLFFFGLGWNPIGSMTGADYTNGLTEMLGNLIENDNVRTYFVASDKHVFFYDSPLGNSEVGGTSLTTWIRGFLGEEESWDHLAP